MEKVYTREQLIEAQRDFWKDWEANPGTYCSLEEAAGYPDRAERSIDALLSFVK